MHEQIKYMDRRGAAAASRPQETPSGAALFTPKQVADYLGVSSAKVYQLIRKGELEAVNLGRLYRVTPSAIERMLDQLKVSV